MKIKKCWCGNESKSKIDEIESKIHLGLRYKFCKKCKSYYQSSEINDSKLKAQYETELQERLKDSFQAPALQQSSLFWGKLDLYAWDITSKNESKSLLDVGCSTGKFMEYANNNGFRFEVFGLDTNTKALENIKFTKNLFYQDLLNCDIESDYFDIVTCHDVLEHVSSPLDYIKEMYRITKDNGVIQLTVPNHFGLDISNWQMARPDHLWLFCESALENIFKKAGVKGKIYFEDISKYTYKNSIMAVIRCQKK